MTDFSEQKREASCDSCIHIRVCHWSRKLSDTYITIEQALNEALPLHLSGKGIPVAGRRSRILDLLVEEVKIHCGMYKEEVSESMEGKRVEKIKSVVHVWERGDLELRAVQLMDNVIAFQNKPKGSVLWRDCDTLCLADMWAFLSSAKNWKDPDGNNK